jgi:hypothetical protein
MSLHLLAARSFEPADAEGTRRKKTPVGDRGGSVSSMRRDEEDF